MNASMRIATGSTVKGATAWQQYDPTNALMRGVFALWTQQTLGSLWSIRRVRSNAD